MEPLKFQVLEEKIEKLISRIHLLEEENKKIKEENIKLQEEINSLKSVSQDAEGQIDKLLQKLSFIDDNG